MMFTPASSLRAIVAGSPILTTILNRWSSIDLPDCWLSGSAIAQTVWNAAFGLSPEYGLADIDLVYFDAADLSEEGEALQAARIRSLFPDMPLGSTPKMRRVSTSGMTPNSAIRSRLPIERTSHFNLPDDGERGRDPT